MSIIAKCYIVSKEHGTTSQDSLGVNIEAGRFAIADGVANSNHPEIFSRLLCESFVKSDIPSEEWQQTFADIILPDLCKQWKEDEQEIFSHLTERKKQKAQIRRDYLSPGSSTFLGLKINTSTKEIVYHILGDSSLFYLTYDSSYFAINSKAKSSYKGEMLNFGNMPDCISAKGTIIGEWTSGMMILKDGYLAMMTDGCANWFQKAYNNDSVIIEQLWNIKDNNEFCNFVNEIWKQKPQYEDDWSLILLKIETDKRILEYFPDNQQAVLVPDDNGNNEADETLYYSANINMSIESNHKESRLELLESNVIDSNNEHFMEDGQVAVEDDNIIFDETDIVDMKEDAMESVQGEKEYYTESEED